MINEFIMIVLLCSACILLGCFLLHIFKWKTGLLESFVWGLAGLIAVFHLLAYPLFLLKTSFTMLFSIYSTIIIVLLLLSIASFIRKREYIILLNNAIKNISNFSQIPFLLLLLAMLIAALIYTCIFCYHPTVDDGYYLARSMEVIAQNSLDIHPSQSWYGETINNYPNLTDASTLSFFISYLSYLFKLSPAIICRRGFAFLLILAHLSAVLIVYDTMEGTGSRTHDKKVFFLIVYILFQITAEKVCSSGRWITSYIWQGKAMLMALIFPLLLIACANIIRNIHDNNNSSAEWLSVAVVLTAGISVSTVGLFLPLILFFSYGIAFLAVSGARSFRKIFVPALLSALPVIICGVISYLNIATVNTRYFEIGKTADWSWLQQFFRANDIFQFSIFILGCI